MDNVNTYKVNEEAVKKIAERVYDNGSTVINRNDLEEMFPELKESEDERIRKEILGFLKTNNAWNKEWIAWLEKQGQVKYSTISQYENRMSKENDNSLTCEDEKIRKALIKYYSFDKDGGSHALDNITPEQIVAWLEKQGEQKSTIEMKSVEESLGIDSDTYNNIVDECIYGEQKPAWSKEDDGMLHGIIAFISTTGCDVEGFETWIDWLKALKDRVQPQPQWKPSDEQMNALNDVISSRNIKYDVLSELWEDLKKLKG